MKKSLDELPEAEQVNYYRELVMQKEHRNEQQRKDIERLKDELIKTEAKISILKEVIIGVKEGAW